MTDVDSILQTEKQQHYSLDNPDLMAFATLTQIAHEQAQASIRSRFKIGIVLCLLVSLAALQAFAFSNLSFSQFSQSLDNMITHHPLYLTVINSALAASILLARKLRFF